jgi:hypothetical protein
MPRFFFNLRVNESYLPDQDGDDCPTLQEAAHRALGSTSKLVQELDSARDLMSKAAVEITDERGQLKLRIPFSLASHSS